MDGSGKNNSSKGVQFSCFCVTNGEKLWGVVAARLLLHLRYEPPTGPWRVIKIFTPALYAHVWLAGSLIMCPSECVYELPTKWTSWEDGRGARVKWAVRVVNWVNDLKISEHRVLFQFHQRLIAIQSRRVGKDIPNLWEHPQFID